MGRGSPCSAVTSAARTFPEASLAATTFDLFDLGCVDDFDLDAGTPNADADAPDSTCHAAVSSGRGVLREVPLEEPLEEPFEGSLEDSLGGSLGDSLG